MRYPLIILMRHTCQVVLMDGDTGSWELMTPGIRRNFTSTDEALNYLRFWRSDPGALNDLRWVWLRTGSTSAGPRGNGPDDLFRALAGLLVQQTLLVLENSLQRAPLARLSLPADAAGAALAALPDLIDVPSEPVLPPLLPALEKIQIEGAEVMPEVIQSLEQIDATLQTVAGVSVSLAPAKVPLVKDSMTKASTGLRAELDNL